MSESKSLPTLCETATIQWVPGPLSRR